jgi:hypothetical protein
MILQGENSGIINYTFELEFICLYMFVPYTILLITKYYL